MQRVEIYENNILAHKNMIGKGYVLFSSSNL